ncbi:MAG: hypothetical protein KZQ93_11840 [Candidatus Thiodiazotropha sp. (ex Monitilora ramsayi)]|nr:hypothetical protein [Candidatus Thiodiazotropha sp. (ex Monitilora ramsayi)]
MKMTTNGLAALLLVVVTTAFIQTAGAAIIDFESAALGTDQTSNYLEDGFRLSSVVGDYDIYPSDSFIGDGQYLALERTDGLLQSTVRIDMFGSLFNFESLVSSSFGGRISFSDGGTELFGDFVTEPVTVAFPGHTNLTWIELTSRSNDFFRIDNITLSVPEPSLLILSAAGLFCLGLVRLGRQA